MIKTQHILLPLAMLLFVCLVPITAWPASKSPSTHEMDAVFPSEASRQKTETIAKDSRKGLNITAGSTAPLEKRIQLIESRLGPASRQPTFTTTIAQHLTDIEQRLDRLELQYKRIQQMEQRIRKIEAQRY